MSDIIYTFKNNAYFILQFIVYKLYFITDKIFLLIESVTSMKPSERQQNFGTTTILLSKRSRQLLMLLILQIIRKPSSAATGNRPVPTII